MASSDLHGSKIATIKGSVMQASVYDERLDGRQMANLESFQANAMTVAHRTLPLGTLILLINEATGKWAIAIVTDRGPYVRGRHIDLSVGVAEKLEVIPGKNGTAPVTVYILKLGKKK